MIIKMFRRPLSPFEFFLSLEKGSQRTFCSSPVCFFREHILQFKNFGKNAHAEKKQRKALIASWLIVF